LPKPDPAEVHAIVRALWRCREREYQYVALDLLAATSKKLAPAPTLNLIEELALDKPWWDTVDGLASIASAILYRHTDLRGRVLDWSAHASMWVNRLALLHQNGWGAETDPSILFELCLRHAASREFFVRKAIGWALRDYAWVNPKAVATFVDENRSKLSPLAMREAIKNIAEGKTRGAGRGRTKSKTEPS
jgi:3-methyladenine DNA glycosylase AlkD